MKHRWTAALTLGALSLAAAAATCVLAAGPAAAAPTGNLLKNIAYYTVNSNGPFCRSTTPGSTPTQNGGSASQSRNAAGNGPVTLSIVGSGNYADDGFYLPLGALGDLAGYTVSGQGDAFETNLWFDPNNDGFFSWGDDGCLTSIDDPYGLGPASAPTIDGEALTVDDSSTFDLTCNGVYRPVSLADLKSGACEGITADTPVAAWIGITSGGESLAATITSAHLG